MASGLVLTSIRPTVACASAVDGRGERSRRGVPTSRASGNSWWAPLFGWSPEPDYIDAAPGAGAAAAEKGAAAAAAAAEGDEREKKGRQQAVATRRLRFSAFTEEKAKQLRIRMMETEAFHDAMYHSAIASRLASDVPRRGSA